MGQNAAFRAESEVVLIVDNISQSGEKMGRIGDSSKAKVWRPPVLNEQIAAPGAAYEASHGIFSRR